MNITKYVLYVEENTNYIVHIHIGQYISRFYKLKKTNYFIIKMDHEQTLLDLVSRLCSYKTENLPMLSILTNYINHNEFDINEQDDNGTSAIMFIIMYTNSVECLDLLYQHGANIMMRDYHGNSLFDWAIKEQNQETIDWITRHINLINRTHEITCSA